MELASLFSPETDQADEADIPEVREHPPLSGFHPPHVEALLSVFQNYG
jgi:hypothetical protein